ncbi:hypothetical protein [Klebsiella variicola]|jgi:hypothetical protein|uniref:hypothetical protein n=1 Tax=Klebsiella variicola TaxID=244366 RepID=UPI000B537BA6|nr:hypothetical protein [Klebsiella variicola]HCI5691134.1 hypothetical protein [Klebsiella variicola subsp. variicola]MDD9590665.1 hypothetical protein [Klebsiella variicola]OWW14756.1 hypothetical protein BUE65_17290 [Klebsiella variicola]PXL08345.1 hypothetical protein DMS46_22200 [Klebsiella variicola]QLS62054.1 hypothetical protein HV312_23300 [Klebsiella variicola]
MINQKIRLIYSDCSSNEQNHQREKKYAVPGDQLGLFDDFTTLKIIFIPVADITSHLFINTIEKNDPYLLLDTREFPDFFSIFISTEDALDEFKKNKIQYVRLPVTDTQDKNEGSWKQLSKLKSILVDHLERKTNSPIIILSSTKSNLEKVSKKLIGYIKQEIAQVKFEHVID